MPLGHRAGRRPSAHADPGPAGRPACEIVSACWPSRRRPACPGTRPCGRPWTGASTSARPRSRCCGRGCRSSRVAPTSRRSRPSAPSRASTSSTRVAGLVDKSVLEPHSSRGTGALPDAGDDPRVRRRAARRARRGRADARPAPRPLHRVGPLESRAAWFGPDQLNWLARTTADLGNLRAAFDHALAGRARPRRRLELVDRLAWYWRPAGALGRGRPVVRAGAGHEPATRAVARPPSSSLPTPSFSAGERNDVEACAGGRAARDVCCRRRANPRRPGGPGTLRGSRGHSHRRLGCALAENHSALREFQAAGDL